MDLESLAQMTVKGFEDIGVEMRENHEMLEARLDLIDANTHRDRAELYAIGKRVTKLEGKNFPGLRKRARVTK